MNVHGAPPLRFGHAPEPVESQRSRHAMILPLSGKLPEALRGLAEACVAWLGRGDIAKALNTDAAAHLADMAWTEGTIAATFPLAPPSPLAMATTWVPGLRSFWHLKKGLKYRKLPQRHLPPSSSLACQVNGRTCTKSYTGRSQSSAWLWTFATARSFGNGTSNCANCAKRERLSTSAASLPKRRGAELRYPAFLTNVEVPGCKYGQQTLRRQMAACQLWGCARLRGRTGSRRPVLARGFRRRAPIWGSTFLPYCDSFLILG